MKYKKTIQKIQASEELKQETIDKLVFENEAIKNKTETKKSKRFNRSFGKMAVSVSMAAVLIFCAVFIPLYYLGGDDNPNVYTAKRNEIIEEIKKYGNSTNLQNKGEISTDAESPAATPESGSSGDYAKTNVQIEGIDEGDIIKVDDNYIYKLSSAGLVIVSVQNGMKISCEKKYDNFVPVEMFKLDNKLIVIGGVYESYNYSGSKNMGAAIDLCYISYQNTRIYIYDLKNIDNLIELKEKVVYDITGYFLTSRLIDNKLIFTVDYNFNFYNENTYFPKVNSKEIEAEKIYICNTKWYRNYIITASIDLNNLGINYSAHLGLYGTAYVSKDYIYFFNADYSGVKYNYWGQRGIVVTKIFKISLGNLKCEAFGKIDGTVDNRYYADEYEGNLRVVSFVPYWADSLDKSYTNVYVLDKNLKQLGKISNIAVSERIYSVRFNKTEGSIVTFKQIDPLFKLDLSNPENPKISDGLKEDGVSDYLQYLGNNMLLGLGRNAVTNEWGTTSFQGMKISLYDNSGANAVNINTINIGEGYAYSEALYNPKAILNDTAKNMFSFAVDMWDYNVNGMYRGISAQGLAVFEYDFTKQDNSEKLIFRGILSNFEGVDYYGNDWYKYYDSYHDYVTRGVRIGDKIYTISDRYITSYDLTTLKLIERLQIAEFKSAAELFGI